MHIKKFFLTIFLFTSIVFSYSYEYLDPKKEPEKFKEKGINDLVPKHTGEKIVFRNSDRIAKVVVFTVKGAPSEVKKELREIITATGMEIASETNIFAGGYQELLTGYGSADVKKRRKKKLDLLKAERINLYAYRRIVIKAKYNVIEEIHEYSELQIDMIDGRDVFEKPCTLVVLERTDHWRDWPREWHTGIRIKLIKVPAEGPIVTETEIKMIEELKSKLGIKGGSYFFPESPYYPLLDIEIMKKIKEEIKEFETRIFLSDSEKTLYGSKPQVDKTQKRTMFLSKPRVPNLFKVSKDLYRGGQPTAEGIVKLNEMGIKTIVNLRSFHSDRDEIGDTKIGYEHIYMKAWHPEEREIVRFLQIVTDPAKAPIFVHCQYGSDRTGVMSAIYRIVIQGWTKEDAIKEMTEGNFGFHKTWINLIEFIRGLDTEKIKRAIRSKQSTE